MIAKIKNYLKVVMDFVAGSNKEDHLKLGFGTAIAVLKRKRIGFVQKYAGISWIRKKGALYISPKHEPNPHIVISGMSGFGKSTLFKSLLLDIINAKISCIIFDAHNEHSDIVRSLNGKVHNAIYSGINILELDGATVSERIAELTRLLKHTYLLGYIQATKLSECLWYTYRKAGASARNDRVLVRVPNMSDLLNELNIFIKNSRSVGERNTLMHLKDRLSLLNNSAFSGGLTESMGVITNGLHSFSIGSMKSKESQTIYISELLNRIYARMHDSRKSDSPRLYVMIDEAQFLVDNSNDNPVIAKLIEEGRKYGMGAIIVTHAANTLNRRIIANSATFMTFYAREPSEANYVTKILSGSNPDIAGAIRERLGTLKENQAILVSGENRSPILISTPGYEKIRNAYRRPLKGEVNIEQLRAFAKKPVPLEDITRFGISEEVLVVLLNSKVLSMYRTSNKGKTECWIMTYNKRLSIEHEVWVKRLSDELNSAGIYNFTARYCGPDITVKLNGRKIAIEYETGLKIARDTIRMIGSRTKAYDATIVVTNDRVFYSYCELLRGLKVRIIAARDFGTLIGILKSMA